MSDDASGILLRRCHLAERGAADRETVIHSSGDTAGAGLGGRDGSAVFAGRNARKNLIFSAADQRGGNVELILSVKGDIERHVSRDAADIRIGSDGRRIGALRDEAERFIVIVIVGVGNVLKLNRGIAETVRHAHDRRRDVHELGEDVLHILDHGVARKDVRHLAEKTYDLLKIIGEIVHRAAARIDPSAGGVIAAAGVSVVAPPAGISGIAAAVAAGCRPRNVGIHSADDIAAVSEQLKDLLHQRTGFGL